jgi:hypothetical protein
MEIIVALKDQYGVQTIVPVCEKAQLFAELAGTKTLTKQSVEKIKALGYAVQVKQPEVVL